MRIRLHTGRVTEQVMGVMAGLSLMFFVSCSSKTHNKRANENDAINQQLMQEVKAEENVEKSFVVEKEQPKAEIKESQESNKAEVGVLKRALEKEFLLQTSIVNRDVVPRWTGLKSRIVAFKKVENEIFMLEAVKGHVVTEELPQEIIITSFPILKETDEKIVFDFNKGMSKIFGLGDWQASDFKEDSESKQWKSGDVKVSYLSKVEFLNNALVIDQIAQLDELEAQNTSEQATGIVHVNKNVRMRYYLSSYNPDPTYVPVETTDFKNFGFFEVVPQFVNDKKVTFATKFHQDKPIVWGVSKNTPEKYKGAVKEGILYWNIALGKNLVKVVEIDDNISTPDFNVNIVQWIPWKQAGGAYADGQMDPRTGEILHAQVWLGSGIEQWASSEVFLDQKVYDDDENVGVMLKGFEPSLRSDNHVIKMFKKAMVELSIKKASKDVMLKATQDFVRAIVAHEVGHCFGLRHNFIGSQYSNLPLSMKEEATEKYFKTGRAPQGIYTGSSIMEYAETEDWFLTGAEIPFMKKALEHDFKAIQTLYFGKRYDRSEIPPFCTDSHLYLDNYIDCEVWDTGRNTVEFVSYQNQNSFRLYQEEILSAFIFTKTLVKKDLSKVQLSPSTSAKDLLSAKTYIFRGLMNNSKVMNVRSKYDVIGELEIADVRAEEMKYFSDLVGEYGGLGALLVAPEINFERELTSFSALLEKYQSGTDLEGNEYEFSREEKGLIISKMKKFLELLPKELLKEELNLLSVNQRNGQIIDSPLGDSFSVFLRERARTVVFGMRDGAFISGSVGERTVNLPIFKHPFKERLAAASLLRPGRGEAVTWGMFDRTILKKELSKLMEDRLGTSPDNVDPTTYPEPMARWIVENQAVLAAFDSSEAVVIE